MNTKNIQLILLLTTFVLHSAFVYSQKDRTERKISNAVDKYNQEALTLLKKVTNINSGTMNFQGVEQTGKVFLEKLRALGLDARWEPGNSFNRSGHVIVSQKGVKGPVIMLIGHLDTVFEPESPFQQHIMLNDSIMQGPGVADMKGGNVIMLLALQALHDVGVLEKMSLEIVLTGDEEKSGSPIGLSKKALVEAAKKSDIALGFENGDGNPATAVVSRRGSMGWELRVTGNAAHSSQIFTDKVGTGAIYEATRILNGFYTQLSKEPNLTFNPGFILGGTEVSPEQEIAGGSAYGKTNVVAKEVVVRGDLRAVSLQQLEYSKKIMEDIVKASYPGTSAKLTFNEGGYPPLAPEEGNYTLLSWYSEVSEGLGLGKVSPVHPRNAGAADISFTAGHVGMALDGIGMSGADDHTINETANVYQLPRLAKRAATLMYRLYNGTYKP